MLLYFFKPSNKTYFAFCGSFKYLFDKIKASLLQTKFFSINVAITVGVVLYEKHSFYHKVFDFL